MEYLHQLPMKLQGLSNILAIDKDPGIDSQKRDSRNAGYPIKAPVVDIVEIGTEMDHLLSD